MIKVVVFISGGILPVLALATIPTIIYGFMQSNMEFATSLIVLALLTISISYLIRKFVLPTRQLTTIQGFGAVGLSWIFMSLFGTIPYVLSGIDLSYTNIFFETVSGLTTTGSSILTDIEAVDKSLLIWRSTTQWLGGMGVIVLTITVLPLLGSGGINLFKAESPGPSADRLTPKFKDTAKLLWIVYISLTILQTILLYYSGLNIFDAFNHSLTTLSTGGFSTFNTSVSEFSTLSIFIINIFMYLAGTSFILLLKTIRSKSLSEFFKSTEFLFYSFMVISTAIIFLFKTIRINENIFESINNAFFTSLTLITTTGFTNLNYENWNINYKTFILGLMFLGGMAGSTAGGLKTIRVIALLKSVRNEIRKIFYPNAIFKIRMSKSILPEKMIESVQTFFILYVAIFVLGTFAISISSNYHGTPLSFEATMSAVASAMNNIGPGLGEISPVKNYFFIDSLTKTLLSLLMIIGRLEIFPIAILLYRKTWKS
ncbi:MAG: TrkH family potassium uptake protein [Actinomycetota bacterium]|nr:TrkH family potassium uptake protein [Actinomycetota bacterium]